MSDYHIMEWDAAMLKVWSDEARRGRIKSPGKIKNERRLEELINNKTDYVLDTSLSLEDIPQLFYKDLRTSEKNQAELLIKLEAILGEAVPKIISKVRNKYGEVTGLIMQRIDGRNLYEFVRSDDLQKYGRQVAAQIKDIYSKLEKNNTALGDSAPHNVIVTYDGKVVVVDPRDGFVDPNEDRKYFRLLAAFVEESLKHY